LTLTRITLSVNGSMRTLEVEPREFLIDTIRDSLGLTGTKKGCDETVCGACAVLVAGKAICSCTMLSVEADGSEVVTIEGLADAHELAPIQEAFVKSDALQCGFCTSGQIIAAKSFLTGLRGRIPDEQEVREAMSGNLCRCGCYTKIVEAVMEVAERSGDG
jgi:xanthine dehydrogenase YagT iron-sulfur-binding subunit